MEKLSDEKTPSPGLGPEAGPAKPEGEGAGAGALAAPGAARTKGRRRALIVLLVVAAVLVVASSVFAGVVSWRLRLASSGNATISEPTPVEAVRDSAEAAGRTDVTAAYSSIVAAEGHEASVSFAWDDDWFFDDSYSYNHELARAAAVFSTVANSESAHYQADSGVPDYMESLLAKLGFENASTASYEYRSEIIDQLAAVFQPNGTNVTAYTIASKHITNSKTGEKKLLLMVAVRGSYGTEWLSNLQMGVSDGIAEGLTVGKGDHSGFSETSFELASAIFGYLRSLQETDPDAARGNVSLFLCGHSRGGAAANLTAAYFDKVADGFVDAEASIEESGGDADLSGSYIHADSVFCYGFATPGVTDNADSREELFGNIYNILNPADLVPRMPLSAWGYSRYGKDLWLPEHGDDGFNATFDRVKEKFREIVGQDTQSDPKDVEDVDRIVSDIGQVAPTLGELATPLGVVKTVGALLDGHDVVRIIHSHAPDLYIAWVSTIDSAQLKASR